MESFRASKGFIMRMPDGLLYKSNKEGLTGYFHKYSFHNKIGDVDACYSLGVCYYLGIGTSRNEGEAFEYFLKAANRNHAIAQYNMFIAYTNGYYCGRNIAEGLKMLRLSISNNCPEAMDAYADALANGKPEWGIRRDRDEADSMYNKAIEIYLQRRDAGEAEAFFELGDHKAIGVGYDFCPNLDDAIDFYIQGIYAGAHRDFLQHLRDMRINLPKIASQLQEWTLEEIYKLGLAYLDGNEPNIPKKEYYARNIIGQIANYYRPAAEMDDWFEGKRSTRPSAYRRTAQQTQQNQSYQQQTNTPSQTTTSSGNNRSEMLLSLGYAYYTGNGVSKDEALAVDYFKQAADLGSADACEVLGECYRNGNGCKRNHFESFAWFSKAYERGANEIAAAYIASYYWEKKDYKTAFRYAIRACNCTNPKAQAHGHYICALCYFYGLGGATKDNYLASADCFKARQLNPDDPNIKLLWREIESKR